MEYYDVFISCNSKDYAIAEELYNYLEDNGFKVFLASMELRKLGESDYRNTISEAIESTYHLIVLGSSIENIASKWVKYEWGLFLGEKLDGHKEGNLMTFVHGNLYVKDLPIDLRHVESFTEADYKDRIIEYVKTPKSVEPHNEPEKKNSYLDETKLWAKRISFLLLVFGIFISSCFGIGFLWGYYTSSSDIESVIVDNTTIKNDSLIFEIAKIKVVYDLKKDTIYSPIYAPEIVKKDKVTPLSRSEIFWGLFTFQSIYKLTERNLSYLKYLKFLKSGSKPSKIVLFCAGIAISVGSACGVSQGIYFGRISRQEETIDSLKLTDKSTWKPLFDKHPEIKLDRSLK